MTKTTTLKAISLATVISITTAFSTTAFANDISGDYDTSAVTAQSSVTKENAQNLVKSLLKRDYGNNEYKAGTTKKINEQWVITIRDRSRTVATASVNSNNGNIHVN